MRPYLVKEVWEQVDTTQHNTVCRHPGCHANCCVGCKLNSSLDPDTVLQGCFAMTNSRCRRCGHSLTEHYHHFSLWKKRKQTQKVIIEGLDQRSNDAGQRTDEYEKMIFDLGKSIADIDEELEDLLALLARLKDTLLCVSLAASSDMSERQRRFGRGI